MSKIFTTLAALITASACAAAAQTSEPYQTSAYEPPAATECVIDASRTRHGMRFEARAHAFQPVSGEYEFVLTKRDAGGSSDIVQGGAFAIAAGDGEVLGGAELSLERGAHYRARLVLWGADGEICRDERRS